ncbi:MAG: sulfotransferase family protein [Mesorhizobium sp.]|uniref:sulfotransferase family protein n=1 Tax=Mesorhizobium sp. TaxID=1871066 RepID=UPI000FE87666|nr:sulfotransferase family protein [Mesorhizobium sp.]RWD51328.1 MAG: sulfotransferase family protein [Mesorhizobium sp.]RWE63650.1 MAG: sulfotransferase family protein [Mesorhizobium sp.]RWF12455.1 MAG: sulfotransferase family protein [Mesorhizobium sp.]RWF18247.1 MAG: sulfotransferase family protein [Mesorhizobium sp.]TIW47411.1 MAG: sulfotransferase family protein [Mesorhizobium sp.]
MALDVIGAGMGRTGTFSLKLALEHLGFGPCHHMADVNANPEQKVLWRAAGQGQLPNWDVAYAVYRSAVDWPTAHFWREVSDHYPDAKVVLTVRDPEAWYNSVAQTIGLAMDAGSNDPQSFGVAVVGNGVFGGRFNDRDQAIAVYEAHNAAVRATLPSERLLTYQVSEGWESLCAFLGVQLATEPFPRTNSTAEFRARIGR